MDFTSIEKNKRFLLIKSEYKTIEKLFTMHTKHSITTDDLKQKLKIHQLRLNECFKQINEINQKIKEMELVNKGMIKEFLICEYLLYNNDFETAMSYAIKHKIYMNFDFYKEMFKIAEEIRNKNFKNSLIFCKTYRIHLKGLLLENTNFNCGELETKLRIYEFMKIIEEKKIKEAFLYAQEYFKKNVDDLKEYLLLLTQGKKIENIESLDEISILFKKIYLKLFKQPEISRFRKTIELGIIAYKTRLCGIKLNPNCPTCLCIVSNLRKNVPYSKKEYSIILCKATGALMNEKNQPFAFESGFVYCENYIKKLEYNFICKETGEICKEAPTKCYFV